MSGWGRWARGVGGVRELESGCVRALSACIVVLLGGGGGFGRVVCGQCIDPGIALIDGISGLLFFQLLRRFLLLTLCHKAPNDEQGNAQSCKG